MSEDHVIPDADELDYLAWFRQNADFGPASGDVIMYMDEDFGPASGDVIMYMDEDFERETGTRVPKTWRYEEE